jgi:predicted nucleic acid-binding protein
MPEEKDPNIIIDASSLIALYKLNLIEILKDLFTSINAPEAVFTEVGQDLPQWIKILPVKKKKCQARKPYRNILEPGKITGKNSRHQAIRQ